MTRLSVIRSESGYKAFYENTLTKQYIIEAVTRSEFIDRLDALSEEIAEELTERNFNPDNIIIREVPDSDIDRLSSLPIFPDSCLTVGDIARNDVSELLSLDEVRTREFMEDFVAFMQLPKIKDLMQNNKAVPDGFLWPEGKVSSSDSLILQMREVKLALQQASLSDGVLEDYIVALDQNIKKAFAQALDIRQKMEETLRRDEQVVAEELPGHEGSIHRLFPENSENEPSDLPNVQEMVSILIEQEMTEVLRWQPGFLSGEKTLPEGLGVITQPVTDQGILADVASSLDSADVDSTEGGGKKIKEKSRHKPGRRLQVL